MTFQTTTILFINEDKASYFDCLSCILISRTILGCYVNIIRLVVSGQPTPGKMDHMDLDHMDLDHMVNVKLSEYM